MLKIGKSGLQMMYNVHCTLYTLRGNGLLVDKTKIPMKELMGFFFTTNLGILEQEQR